MAINLQEDKVQPDDNKQISPFLHLHYTNPLLVAGTTSVILLGGFRFWARFVRRIPNVDHLPQEKLVNRTIRGVVTRCVCIRLYREIANLKVIRTQRRRRG